MSGPSVRIAGAGALGLAIAVEMLRCGWRVEVFDPAPPHDNASGVAAGMLAPVSESLLDKDFRAFTLLAAARDRWVVWAERLGLELETSGTLFPAFAASEAEAVVRSAADLGVAGRILTGPEARALQPWLGEDARAAAHLSGDWALDARAALDALRRSVASAGGSVRAALLPAVTPPGSPVVIAAGHAAAQTFPAVELLRLQPIKGQLLRFAGGPTEGATLRGGGVYVVPQRSGAIVGATMEPGRADTTLDAVALASLRTAAQAVAPGLAGRAAAGAAGVRAATPDGLPLVGWGSAENTLLAVGARRNGWLLAPLVAEMVAAYLTGEDPGPHAGALDPRRFEDA